ARPHGAQGAARRVLRDPRWRVVQRRVRRVLRRARSPSPILERIALGDKGAPRSRRAECAPRRVLAERRALALARRRDLLARARRHPAAPLLLVARGLRRARAARSREAGARARRRAPVAAAQLSAREPVEL